MVLSKPDTKPRAWKGRITVKWCEGVEQVVVVVMIHWTITKLQGKISISSSLIITVGISVVQGEKIV